MVDLGSLDLGYVPVIPCNETLYRLYEAQNPIGSNKPAICTKPDAPEDEEDDSGDTGDDNRDTPPDDNGNLGDDWSSNDDGSNDGPSNEDETNEDNNNYDTNKESADDSPDSSSNNQNYSTDVNSSDSDSYIPGDGARETLFLPSIGRLVLIVVGVVSAWIY
ncbi:hypothetical protein BDV12DRAFT_201392 [Aspergillus spectabilis]